MIRIGTRGSALALVQAHGVADTLREQNPGLTVDIEVIKTKGDRVQDRPLHQVGGTGLFTREIERALLDGEVDVAVHSLKDLPARMRAGLALGAVPRREDARDAWICPAGVRLDDLPPGARVATGALRRRVQLLALRPDLVLTEMRGNLDTRLRKVHDLPELDATLVGAAGLSRMGWLDRATALLDPEVFTRVTTAASTSGGDIIVPSGAVGGIDALRACRGHLDSVTIVSTKKPESLRGAPGFAAWEDVPIPGPTVVFEGPASAAVDQFPANVNVAATVSLAGIGPQATQVKVIADPDAPGNVHQIDASGPFGELSFRCVNRPYAANPKTSHLAALAAIEALRTYCEPGPRLGT